VEASGDGSEVLAGVGEPAEAEGENAEGAAVGALKDRAEAMLEDEGALSEDEASVLGTHRGIQWESRQDRIVEAPPTGHSRSHGRRRTVDTTLTRRDSRSNARAAGSY
jgi:hypothetical protein